MKVYLHLDEKTPHLQGFMVPIDERGRLNAKHFFDGGKVFDEKRKEWVEKRGRKLRGLQDDYARAMEPLGLERGIKGSIAHHQELQRFYGAINREVRLRINPDRVPDPPRMMVTEASRKGYKAQVIETVARNAVDLVIHVREAHERIPTTAREVTLWLAEAFGKNRAVAATLVRADQQAMAIIREHERSREMETRREPLREIPSREIERTSQREQHEGRSGFFR